MKIGDLFVQIGVSADTFKIKKFKDAINELPSNIAKSIFALADLDLRFESLASHALNMTNTFKIFTAETGMNARALGQWQQVAQQSGISAEVVTNSLINLSSLVARVKIGRGISGEAAQALGRFKLGPETFGMNPNQLMSRVQSGAAGMDPGMAAEFLKALGIAPEMLRVFQTPASVRENIEPIMSQQAIDQLAGFQKELAVFNQTVMREFITVLREFEPYMSQLTEVMASFIKTAGPVAISTFGAAIKEGENIRNGKWMDAASFFPEHSAMGLLGSRVLNYQITQNIHTTADARATAAESDKHFRRSIAKAAADVDNGGR